MAIPVSPASPYKVLFLVLLGALFLLPGLAAQTQPKAKASSDMAALEADVLSAFSTVVAERTIVAGENFQTIADAAYGSKLVWPLVWFFNRQAYPNPERITRGMHLRIPRLKAGLADQATQSALTAAYALVYKQYRSLPGMSNGQRRWVVLQAGNSGVDLTLPGLVDLLAPEDLDWAQRKVKVDPPLTDYTDKLSTARPVAETPAAQLTQPNTKAADSTTPAGNTPSQSIDAADAPKTGDQTQPPIPAEFASSGSRMQLMEDILAGTPLSIATMEAWALAVALSPEAPEVLDTLEKAAGKPDAPPQVVFALSLQYRRLGLIQKEYTALKRTEEAANRRPDVVFNLLLATGRLKLLAASGQIEDLPLKAEFRPLITLHTIVTELKKLSPDDNYHIEKKKPAEAVAYETLKAFDADNNDIIDVREFRNYYPSNHTASAQQLNLDETTCLAVDTVLNATEASDPQELDAATALLSESTEESLADIMEAIAIEKTQPHIRQYQNALVRYNQGISEETWGWVLDNIFDMAIDTKEPCGALYGLNFIFYLHCNFGITPDVIKEYLPPLQAIMQRPEIYTNATYIKKAFQVLSVLKPSIGPAPTLGTFTQQLLTLGGRNLTIEKKISTEAEAYTTYKLWDTNKDNTIDVKEFRTGFLGSMEIRETPVIFDDAHCQSLTELFSDTPPETLGTNDAEYYKHIGLSPKDEAYQTILIQIATDKTRAPIIRMIALEDLYKTQAISEALWEGILFVSLDELMTNSKDTSTYLRSRALWEIDLGYFANNKTNYLKKLQQLRTQVKTYPDLLKKVDALLINAEENALE